MKRSFVFTLAVLCLTLIFGSTGCKSPRKGLTYIPGARPATPGGGGPSGPIVPPPGPATPVEPPPGESPLAKTGSGIELPNADKFANAEAHPEILKDDSVYFDFDRSDVKSSERSKVEAVGSYMKDNAKDLLRIEGNCDERGTEEYNRALGERRALALREYLVNLGISADRITTLSYGKDKPVDPGHNDAAWAKNRRGDFVVLKPKP
ncbi:MAG: OmpA family protein [Verrucomicrobia bacterium]|nr:OmpA family protein [Verrucomicrobiota bacterium]